MAETPRVTIEQAKDLDETRRLLYTVLLDGRTKRSELAATVINALAHHGVGIDPDEATDQVLAALNGDPKSDGKAWVQQRIDEITARLA